MIKKVTVFFGSRMREKMEDETFRSSKEFLRIVMLPSDFVTADMRGCFPKGWAEETFGMGLSERMRLVDYVKASQRVEIHLDFKPNRKDDGEHITIAVRMYKKDERTTFYSRNGFVLLGGILMWCIPTKGESR